MGDLVKEASEATNTIEPISASADGKRNSYSLDCRLTGQCMNYAACLWRQGVLAKPDIKTPTDWNVCGQARREGICNALNMRMEEELAGKAIYFRDRNLMRRAMSTVSKWAMPVVSHFTKPAEHVPAAPRPAKSGGGSMLDAMGSVGSFADAVTEAAKTPAAAPLIARVAAPTLPVANTGESPLQMARRIAAERTARA